MTDIVRSIKKRLPVLGNKLESYLAHREAPKHALPSFIIIGAQKAGTTSLYEYMVQHPDIHPVPVKELHYFDIFYDRGDDWYRNQFPLRDKLGITGITGEASPYYSFHPLALERIHRLLPAVKLVFLLRNPVERAISHYYHEIKDGFETLPILDAFAAETGRLKAGNEALAANPLVNDINLQHFTYRERGKYIEQIEQIVQRFPRQQLLVLDSDTFFANPAPTLRQVFEFVGVDREVVIPDLQPRNVGAYTDIPPALREELKNFYEPYNERLFRWLGYRLPW